MKYEREKPRIFIDSRGRWFQDGIRITHKWTYLENNKNLDKDDQGNLFVREGNVKVYVECEDTPFVVTMVSKTENGILLRLNDKTEEKLDFSTLHIANENIPYANVKNGKFTARLLRSAYYELMKYAGVNKKGVYFEVRGEKHYIEISEGIDRFKDDVEP